MDLIQLFTLCTCTTIPKCFTPYLLHAFLQLMDPKSPTYLDDQRAVMMEHLFMCDGRNDPSHPHAFTYTGLWEKFALDLAANFRDEYYPELFVRVCKAMNADNPAIVHKKAQQAIETCKQSLLGEKWK